MGKSIKKRGSALLAALLIFIPVFMTACSGRSKSESSTSVPEHSAPASTSQAGTTTTIQTKAQQNTGSTANSSGAKSGDSKALPYDDTNSALDDLNSLLNDLDEADEANLDIPNP